MKTETLYIPLSATTEAVVTVTVREEGLGALDAITEKAPAPSEVELIARLIQAKRFMFTSSLL